MNYCYVFIMQDARTGQGYEIYLRKSKTCSLKINTKPLKDIYDIDDLMACLR